MTINVLKTECSLQDYLELTEKDLDNEEWKTFSRPRYMRLDLDYGTLGPIGIIHCRTYISALTIPRAAPSTRAGCSTNVVVDFIEFVYRHFYPKAWLSWAERTWNRDYKGKHRDPGTQPLLAIVSGFAENEIGVLHMLNKDIAELVAVLAEEKGRLYELRMNAADRQMMTFPDWHG